MITIVPRETISPQLAEDRMLEGADDFLARLLQRPIQICRNRRQRRVPLNQADGQRWELPRVVYLRRHDRSYSSL